MAARIQEWSKAPPDAPGLWWYRDPDSDRAVPVEFVPTDKVPLLLYHKSRTYRWLSDEHFEGVEWRGPVAKRTRDGLWYFVG